VEIQASEAADHHLSNWASRSMFAENPSASSSRQHLLPTISTVGKTLRTSRIPPLSRSDLVHWHDPEILESVKYFRLLVHSGPQADLPAD
jgi:hypothetical protein